MRDDLDTNIKTITVVIADDHHLVRRGLAATLKDEIDFDVVGEATTGNEAVDHARALKPDVLLMDVNMPESGWNTAREIKRQSPSTRIVVFSFWSDPEIVEGFRCAGASAYVVKGGAGRALVELLRSVFQDETFRLLEPA